MIITVNGVEYEFTLVDRESAEIEAYRNDHDENWTVDLPSGARCLIDDLDYSGLVDTGFAYLAVATLVKEQEKQDQINALADDLQDSVAIGDSQNLPVSIKESARAVWALRQAKRLYALGWRPEGKQE